MAGAAPGATGYAVPASAATSGYASSSSGPNDFHRLSAEELRHRLELGAAKLSDAALDNELALASIKVPAGATRADKVKLYVQSPEDAQNAANAKAQAKSAAKKPAKEKKSEGEKLLEVRKKWLEEWESWDDVRLVKRLAKLGVDGDGLARAQLLDELLEVETDRYSNRCNPQRIQKFALVGVGGAVLLTFLGVVVGLIASS
jgi:hypothetical protein